MAKAARAVERRMAGEVLMPKKRDLLDTLHVRLRKLCRAVQIENASQLAVAVARAQGKVNPVASELSQSGPNGWWNGTRTPDLKQLVDICAATGGSLDYLVLDRGPMFPLPEATLRALSGTRSEPRSG